MKQLTDDEMIFKNMGCEIATVYIGGFSNLQKIELVWDLYDKEENGMMAHGFTTAHLTLGQIAEQCKGKGRIITIFEDTPLHGRILQYGNYGESWYLLGETAGYA